MSAKARSPKVFRMWGVCVYVGQNVFRRFSCWLFLKTSKTGGGCLKKHTQLTHGSVAPDFQLATQCRASPKNNSSGGDPVAGIHFGEARAAAAERPRMAERAPRVAQGAHDFTSHSQPKANRPVRSQFLWSTIGHGPKLVKSGEDFCCFSSPAPSTSMTPGAVSLPAGARLDQIHTCLGLKFVSWKPVVTCGTCWVSVAVFCDTGRFE